jgi:hypothetical protein
MSTDSDVVLDETGKKEKCWVYVAGPLLWQNYFRNERA